MGIRIPPPIIVPPGDAGDNCTRCWGVGKDFGDGDTPDHIWINFSGLNKTDDWGILLGEPIDGLFMLDQNPGFPCRFDALEGDFLFDVRFDAGTTTVFVEFAGVATQWNSTSGDECSLVNFGSDEFGFEGGTALIIIPEVD